MESWSKSLLIKALGTDLQNNKTKTHHTPKNKTQKHQQTNDKQT